MSKRFRQPQISIRPQKYLHKPPINPDGNVTVISLHFSSGNGQSNLSRKDTICCPVQLLNKSIKKSP